MYDPNDDPFAPEEWQEALDKIFGVYDDTPVVDCTPEKETEGPAPNKLVCGNCDYFMATHPDTYTGCIREGKFYAEHRDACDSFEKRVSVFNTICPECGSFAAEGFNDVYCSKKECGNGKWLTK